MPVYAGLFRFKYLKISFTFGFFVLIVNGFSINMYTQMVGFPGMQSGNIGRRVAGPPLSNLTARFYYKCFFFQQDDRSLESFFS